MDVRSGMGTIAKVMRLLAVVCAAVAAVTYVAARDEGAKMVGAITFGFVAVLMFAVAWVLANFAEG